jgi:hypothetical protein
MLEFMYCTLIMNEQDSENLKSPVNKLHQNIKHELACLFQNHNLISFVLKSSDIHEGDGKF